MKTFKLSLFFALSAFCASLVLAQSLPPVKEGVTRPWIGPEFWTNPIMNWRLSDGRIENTHGGWVNETHSLTHQLKPGKGAFRMSVRMGLMENSDTKTKEIGFAGFKFGAVGHRNDYRSNILHDLSNGFAKELTQESPVWAGLATDGRLVIGPHYSTSRIDPEQMDDAGLELKVSYDGNEVEARLSVSNADQEIAFLESTIQRASLSGNVALACHGLTQPRSYHRSTPEIDHPRFWFKDWEVDGNKFQSNEEQTYGPILWSQYTLQRNTLNLMAFFTSIEEEGNQLAELQVRSGSGWKTVAKNEIDSLSSTALFRVENWNDDVDQEYRVAFSWDSVEGPSLATWGGTIRKDPLEKESIVLAGLSCSNSELFPNRFLVENLIEQDPDLVFFSGDQIYESNGGYWTVKANTKAEVPRAALNYLGKFHLSIVGFRDLLKDRPTVMVPDDHDLYSNDLWGKGGMEMQRERCFGGYGMHSDWVKMVEYTQMGNRPDPYDSSPIEQGIRVYTTSLDVGGVSFALINDRKFKSAPGDVVDAMEPLFAMRGEHNYAQMDTIKEENFDTRNLNREDLQLLGQRQLDFLREWGKDGSKLRAVLSQSAFCQPHHLMVADMDSNGWPQSGRDRALEVIREAKAVMVTGDLHFATLVQQGVDDWEDAGWSFTLPSVSTQNHRAWRPKVEGQNRLPGMPDYTGRYLDGWGNKITVWAAANPYSFLIEDPYKGEGESTLEYLRNSGQGYGIVRFNKMEDTVTFESWPVYGTFKGPQAHQQHPGFPKTVNVD